MFSVWLSEKCFLCKIRKRCTIPDCDSWCPPKVDCRWVDLYRNSGWLGSKHQLTNYPTFTNTTDVIFSFISKILCVFLLPGLNNYPKHTSLNLVMPHSVHWTHYSFKFHNLVFWCHTINETLQQHIDFVEGQNACQVCTIFESSVYGEWC